MRKYLTAPAQGKWPGRTGARGWVPRSRELASTAWHGTAVDGSGCRAFSQKSEIDLIPLSAGRDGWEAGGETAVKSESLARTELWCGDPRSQTDEISRFLPPGRERAVFSMINVEGMASMLWRASCERSGPFSSSSSGACREHGGPGRVSRVDGN